jgi:hypothetical protein
MNNDPEKSSGLLAIVSPNRLGREARENGERTKIIELDNAARQRYADKRKVFLFRPLNPEAA